MEALVIFKAVNDSSEQQMLLQRFLSTDGVVHLKDKSDRNLNLKVVSINSSLHLKCHLPTDVEFNFNKSNRFMATFYIGYEKYMFETQPSISDNTISLPVTELFHLQRRRNFRYTMPRNYSAEFVISHLNQKACSHTTKLLDINPEGCAIEIPHDATNLHMDDLVQAEVFIGDREPITIQGMIKNIRPQGHSHLVLGIEFIHTALPSEDQIVATITDLQRELYFRRAA
ncbi:Flagellar brake protein YcgR [compost metagenome]